MTGETAGEKTRGPLSRPQEGAAQALRTEDLRLTYDDGTEALSGVSLSVPRGACFGFLGPNGAGKTTFIKVLVTLLRPTAGTVTVNGFDRKSDPQAIRETIGYMGQETSIDGELTARENLRFACRAYGVPAAEREERIDELLALVGLEDVADKRAFGFSGGMKKRLDTATALVHEPPLVFLDEPTTGLDPSSREKLWQYFEAINDRGQTIFLTTQYLAEANRLCDTISVIQDGEIVASGTPRELKHRVGDQVLTVELEDEQAKDRAVELVRQVSDHVEVDISDNAISVGAEDIESVAVEILSALQDGAIEIGRFELHEPTLDDVFLTVTGDVSDRESGRLPQEVRT